MTVLAILPMGNGMAHAALTGIRPVAAERRWHLLSAETERMSDGSLRIERSPGSVASVRELATLMRPDGVVVWGYALSPDEVAANVGSVPAVFIDPPFGGSHSALHGGAVVCGDSKSVASLAARELLFRDFADLAFVPSNEDESWNHERGEAFRDCARVAGARYHEFNARRGEALGRWLAALPKPCGLFAANDKAGEEVLGACAALGIAVPQDISVVGVDNMVYLCEGTAPTLSSIMMDHVGEGRAAAELLAGERMLLGNEHSRVIITGGNILISPEDSQVPVSPGGLPLQCRILTEDHFEADCKDRRASWKYVADRDEDGQLFVWLPES